MTYPPQHTLPPAYASHTVVRPTDGLAITSLVLSLIGFGLFGVIFGHVAMSRIRRTGAGGAGLALAGLIIGYLEIAAVLAILVIIGMSLFGVLFITGTA